MNLQCKNCGFISTDKPLVSLSLQIVSVTCVLVFITLRPTTNYYYIESPIKAQQWRKYNTKLVFIVTVWYLMVLFNSAARGHVGLPQTRPYRYCNITFWELFYLDNLSPWYDNSPPTFLF